MPIRAGVRRPVYAGEDPQAEAMSRDIGNALQYLQKLPTSDGMLFQGADFSSFGAAATRTYSLKHTLGRKARGILTLGCHSKLVTPTIPTGLPVHVSKNDTNSVANVLLDAAMANNFTWDFWVW